MTEEEEARDAIVDLAVTTGKAKDRTSDIHTPPARQDSLKNAHRRNVQVDVQQRQPTAAFNDGP